MWDGFELPGEVRRHQLPAPLDETVGTEPVALVGASYGGFVALDFAARRPELVEKLVLLDAPLMDHDFSPEFMEYVEEEERLSEAGELEAAVELNLAFWCPEIADRVRPMAAALSSARTKSSRIRTSARSARRPWWRWASNDKADFRAIAERLARELPNAELAVIAGAGHLPSMERPDETAALVRSFLRS